MARGSRPASEMAPQPTFLVGQRSAIWFAVSGQGAVLALAHRSQHLRSCGSVSCSFIFLTLRVRVSAREVSQGLFLDGSRAVSLTLDLCVHFGLLLSLCGSRVSQKKIFLS